MIKTPKLFKSPTGKGRRFIIDKNTAVLYFRRSFCMLSSKDIEVFLMLYRHICPPVPGRNANLLREIIDTKNTAPLIAAHNNQSTIYAFHGLFYYLDEMGFPFSSNAGNIQFFYFLPVDQLLDFSPKFLPKQSLLL